MRTLTLVLALLAAPAAALAWSPLNTCGGGVYSAWIEDDLPVGYWVNAAQSGTSEATTLDVIERSFGHWYEPCCSGASSSRRGTTGASSLDNGDGQTTIGFLSSDWPSEFGDPSSTLGVTIPIIWSDCRISEADITFNEVGHDFCYSGCSERDTVFEPIATHEIGHVFGLAHSDDHTAVMYYAYMGGTDATLRDDDAAGICALYPASRCGCDGPEDCEAPLECIGGNCVMPDPCEGVTCDPGESCVDGVCVGPSECPICLPCEDEGPCGASGQCIDRGDGQGRCIQFCGAGGSCPGDSVCFQATAGGETVYVCLNEDAAEAGLCPDTYVCTDCTTTGCQAGEQCFDGGCRPDPGSAICVPTDGECTGCPPGSGGCVELEGGQIVCTAQCIVDDDCGPCGGCIDTNDPRVRVCVNRDYGSAGYCPSGWTCDPGSDGDADVDGDIDGDVDADVDADADTDADGDGASDGDGGGRCECRAATRARADGGLALLLALALAGAWRRLRG